MAESQDWLIWYSSLYRYARALCHDPPLAEELVQEAYKRALAAPRKPASAGSADFRRWLFTILRHLWQNELRQRHSHSLREADYRSATQKRGESPEAILDRRLLQSEVLHALDSLPETYREVLILREFEDLSYAEIAEVLECPAGTVMSRLARGRELLRRHLVGSRPAHKESRS